MSRGLKNNNPGNIRISAVSYRGELAPSTDRAFKQFTAPEWGYRAMFVVLHSYAVRYRLTTLRQMIGRYAPPSENNTNGYVASVAKWSDTDSDSKLDTMNGDQMRPVVAAMSRMENGTAAIDDHVHRGWDLFVQYKP